MADKATNSGAAPCLYVPLSEAPSMRELNYDAKVLFQSKKYDREVDYQVQRVEHCNVPEGLQKIHTNFVKFSLREGQDSKVAPDFIEALIKFKSDIQLRGTDLKEAFGEELALNPLDPLKLAGEFEPVKLDKISELTRKNLAVVGKNSVVVVYEKGALTRQEGVSAATLRGKTHTLPEMKRWVKSGAAVVIRSSEMNLDNKPSVKLAKCVGNQIGYYTHVSPSAATDIYPNEIKSVIRDKVKEHDSVDVFVLGIDEKSAHENVKDSPFNLAVAIASEVYDQGKTVNVTAFAMSDS